MIRAAAGAVALVACAAQAAPGEDPLAWLQRAAQAARVCFWRGSYPRERVAQLHKKPGAWAKPFTRGIVTSPGETAVRSAAFGIWAGVGSRDEDRAHAGATHYLEHLLFKGTRKRTALDISAAMDAAGGELNAFTGKEYTCYYARVLDADLPLAVDVLSDMVTASLIEPRGVDGERNVKLLEELCETMVQGSLCGLGGMAPFPVQSALKHFREDFRAQPK